MQPILQVRNLSAKGTKKTPRSVSQPPFPRPLVKRQASRAPVPPVAEHLSEESRAVVTEAPETAFLADTAERLSADWRDSSKPLLEYVPDAAVLKASESPEAMGTLPIVPDRKLPRWVGKSY